MMRLNTEAERSKHSHLALLHIGLALPVRLGCWVQAEVNSLERTEDDSNRNSCTVDDATGLKCAVCMQPSAARQEVPYCLRFHLIFYFFLWFFGLCNPIMVVATVCSSNPGPGPRFRGILSGEVRRIVFHKI